MKRTTVLLIVVAVIAILGYLQRDSIVTVLVLLVIDARIVTVYFSTHVD